jgi:nitrate/nitrite transporter NarK
LGLALADFIRPHHLQKLGGGFDGGAPFTTSGIAGPAGSIRMSLHCCCRWGALGGWTFGILLSIWLLIFLLLALLLARTAPRRAAVKAFSEVIRPLNGNRSWELSLYCFLTFGGFVAMAIYLPIFLTEMFRLSAQDAEIRTAGFVVLATLMRPVGGTSADKIGGRTILKWVFPVVAVMAAFLAWPMMATFPIGDRKNVTGRSKSSYGITACTSFEYPLSCEFVPTAVTT